LDADLNEFSSRNKLTYTRYADDITFSGYRRIFNEKFLSDLGNVRLQTKVDFFLVGVSC
jgi:hypothetical protein